MSSNPEPSTSTGQLPEVERSMPVSDSGSWDPSAASAAQEPFNAAKIERPDPALLNYYFLVSLCSLPMFPIVFVPLLIRYHTMRYRFDEDGVAMSWGFFFRKEVYLTYGRLQDIHVTRNIIERWMGLAKLPIQTASGAHGATMTIEGIRSPEPLRDFLYSRMRGARHEDADGDLPTAVNEESHQATSVTALLVEIRDELRKRNVSPGDDQ